MLDLSTCNFCFEMFRSIIKLLLSFPPMDVMLFVSLPIVLASWTFYGLAVLLMCLLLLILYIHVTSCISMD
ncbi:uncharacterized protein C8R40DRAFT_1076940 [Lentinula edodes]|uniref:uncharacterized protein n=1 Tax=Lentinula edodes TaxID=5353 RepID=UPI001E8D72D7|nr:uncharacterized protein C8R40DRAFT_1076940 [Lentinula edodes]KAH7881196.1 hypothetical protein C8R40DRAFT_1076940 [Lentinula edodes]